MAPDGSETVVRSSAASLLVAIYQSGMTAVDQSVLMQLFGYDRNTLRSVLTLLEGTGSLRGGNADGPAEITRHGLAEAEKAAEAVKIPVRLLRIEFIVDDVADWQRLLAAEARRHGLDTSTRDVFACDGRPLLALRPTQASGDDFPRAVDDFSSAALELLRTRQATADAVLLTPLTADGSSGHPAPVEAPEAASVASSTARQFQYDVALSFAGEDRPYVAVVAERLRAMGISCFYDEFEKANLWGKDLAEHLHLVYSSQARYTVIFVSAHYAQKDWTNHEKRAALERSLRERTEYILPARFDHTRLPGLPSTTAYIELPDLSANDFAALVAQKVRTPPSRLDAEVSPIIDVVLRFYLSGDQYNGLPASDLLAGQVSEEELRRVVGAGHLTVRTERNGFPNPHIRAYSDALLGERLGAYQLSPVQDWVLYPTAEYMSGIGLPEAINAAPFTASIAKGGGQMELRFFEPTVLEWYRLDPRYEVSHDSISGSLFRAHDPDDASDLPERDRVFLKTFGFGRDPASYRPVVGTYTRYLARLSIEHQQVWRARELDGPLPLNPAFDSLSRTGAWPQHISVQRAILAEIGIANSYARLMELPQIWVREYDDERPTDLGVMLRPTRRELRRLLQAMSLVTVGNLSSEFVNAEQVRFGMLATAPTRASEWMRAWSDARIRVSEVRTHKHIAATVDVFQELEEAQHGEDADAYDVSLFRVSCEWYMRVYRGLSTVRQLLGLHPSCRSLAIPDALAQGRIIV